MEAFDSRNLLPSTALDQSLYAENFDLHFNVVLSIITKNKR